MRTILLGRMAAGCEEALRERLGGLAELTAIPDPAKIDDYAAELAVADVIVGWPLTNALVARAPEVKLVQASGAGIDGLDLETLPDGVMAANTFHHEAAIAEWVLMAMLNLARNPAGFDRRLREGQWAGSCIWGEHPVLRELRGETALLIGVGHIAKEIARRAKAFGMRVVGISRRGMEEAGFDLVAGWEGWLDRVAEADYVIPCCPLAEETRGLIGAECLGRMKRDAYVINMTRGPVVDEEALYEALRTKQIGGAAIDTWYQYPRSEEAAVLPSRLPFHELGNVLMSPHVSGWTRPTIEGRIADIAENIRRLRDGEEILHRLR
ncbi:MAG: 2-hydroxyacid dehydrogenase [Bryobacteraceae bacterium]